MNTIITAVIIAIVASVAINFLLAFAMYRRIVKVIQKILVRLGEGEMK